MSKPTAIDLFAGCGGLTLGLKQAGFRVLGAVEIDSLAAETYRTNHPRVRVWEKDIRSVGARRLMRDLSIQSGDIDLLAGCPPCQGFSRMTTLNGRYRTANPQNDLIFEFLRFVRVLRPKAVMLENVPGLAKDRRLGKFLSNLKLMGYGSLSSVLDAADYGVPQRRRRFILLSGARGTPEFARPAPKRVTVRSALKTIASIDRNDALHSAKESRSEKIRKLISLVPRNGGSRSDLGSRRQLACHTKIDGFKDVYGRMSWDKIAPTITGGCCNPSKGRFLHPTQNRCITLREAALLQSFPPSYFFSLKRGKFAAAQMIGNALPPEFIRRHALAIKLSLLTE